MGLTCRDVMVPSTIQKTILPEESVAKALEIIKASRARFLPVVAADGTYIGMFSSPTLLKLILPKAATINMFSENARLNIDNLSFHGISREDFDARVARLKDETVGENLSNPENIPVVSADTGLMEGIFLIYKFKRHLVLVEPGSKKFVGTVSANSVLDNVID